jgi:TolA-binding protein
MPLKPALKTPPPFSRFLSGVAAILLASLLSAAPAANGRADEGDSVRLQSFTTHSRIALRLDEGVQPQLKTTRQGFELVLEGVGLVDLGAPLGEEARWGARFAALKDARLQELRFLETRSALVITGKWRFAKGPDAPAVPEMDWFDYRDKANSRYVIDFWPKKGPTLAQMRASQKRAEETRQARESEEIAKARIARHLASDQKRSEAEDVSRFCRQPLKPSNDAFLRFLPLHEPVHFERWISTTTPDENFVYFVPEAKTEEAQYVRLALALYREGKPALVLRTLDFLERDYPRSTYAREMRFLRANALLKVGLKEDSDKILGELMQSYTDSPVALFAAISLALRQLEKGAHLAALESFQWLIQKYSEHRLAWLFHLGAAESLYGIRQTDRAVKEYQWVAENAPDAKTRAEGALRQGDIFLERFQYDQALAGYFHGLNYFKEEAKDFPSVHLNRAEALYWLEQYDRAEQAFKDFLVAFPAHPAGWRATFRIGEIHARLDKTQPSEEARKWFSETINRFPLSPGATISRLRLVPCGDHAGFDVESAERFFEGEAAQYPESRQTRDNVALNPYQAMRALAYVRTMAQLGRPERAMAAGIAELASNGSSEIRGILSQMLEVMFRNALMALVDRHEQRGTVEALELYRKLGDRIQRTGIIEPDYLLKLSIAASELGLGQQGRELAEAYRRATEYEPEPLSPAEARRPAAERAAPSPGPGDPELRLRDAEKAFAEAKAGWVASGFGADPAVREQVRALLARVTDESPYSAEAELILGLADEKDGKLSDALRHGLKAQLILPKGPGPARDWRIEGWVASLQARSGTPTIALELYRNLENHLRLEQASGAPQAGGPAPMPMVPKERGAAVGVPPVPSLEQVVFAEAGLLEGLGRWGETAQAYSKLVEAKKGGNQALFGFARALLNESAGRPDAAERKKALAMLEKIARSKDNDFWKKMAGERLLTEKTAKRAKEGNP